MRRGLRQAAGWLVGTVGVALVAAGAWTAVTGNGFRPHLGLAMMVIAGLVALTGGNAISRAGSMDAMAFLGRGPENADPDSGEGLTGIGVFLFVSLPLFALGTLIYGTG